MMVACVWRSRFVVVGLASAAMAGCSVQKDAPAAAGAIDSATLKPSASATRASDPAGADEGVIVSRAAGQKSAGAPASNGHVAGAAGVGSEPPVGRGQTARQPALVRPAASGPRQVLLGDLDLTGIGYDRGSKTAPVVMIDLSDFACPYCGEFTRETYPAIERDYVATGKVFFKYVPFVVGSFPHSVEATRAAECAGDQGGFWPMMTQVYEAQRDWKGGGDPFPRLSALASVAGFDTVRLRECYTSNRTDVRTARASNLASDIGVRVTPSFLVNGRPIQGALPLADFRKVIDAALMVAHLRK